MDEWSKTSTALLAPFALIIMVLGIAGNVLVVLVLRKQSTCKRITGRQFLTNLAIADIGGSTNMIFMVVTIMFRGKWIFGDGLCQLNGLLAILFASASMWTLSVISLNRYVRIVKQKHYAAIFTKKTTLLAVAITWLIPLVMAVAPLVGWSAHRYQFGKCSCHFKFSESISYTLTFVFSIVLAPFTAILFSYMNIYKATKQHRKSNSSLRRNQPHIHIEEIRITGTLFVVILVFMLCFIPGSIVNIIEMARPEAQIPSWLDILSFMLVVANHANNPLIYGFLNRSLRKAFWRFLRQCCCFDSERDESIGVDSSVHRSRRSSLKPFPSSPSTRCHSYVVNDPCGNTELV